VICLFWLQSSPARRTAAYEAEDIHITVDLPFLPAPLMWLKVTSDGDYYQVEEVFWDASEPDRVEVFFKLPDQLPLWKTMRAGGWSKT
jgi:hypothetical protein